jgi:hypothetical protein
LTAELRFVDDDWSVIDEILKTGGKAAAHISGVTAPTTFHYVFIDRADTTAVTHLQAASVDANPLAQASGSGWYKEKNGSQVKRIVYELQDTADLMVTHYEKAGGTGGCCWSCGSSECEFPCASGRNWTCRDVAIEVEDPLRDEAGTVVVPAGTQVFLAESCDDMSLLEGRNGYPWKHWWWGTYLYDRKGKFTSEAFAEGTPSGSYGKRHEANGCNSCKGDRWLQHDYFAHSGEVASGDAGTEKGDWLPQGWHRAAKGGSDGRWLQVFPDDPPP